MVTDHAELNTKPTAFTSYSRCVISIINVRNVLTGSYELSALADLHVVGMLQFMSNINQPSFPTPFYSVLVSISVFMAFSPVIHSIYSPDNSPFSHYVLPVLSLPY